LVRWKVNDLVGTMAFGDMGERMMMGCFWSGLGLMLSEGVYNTKAMLLSSISPGRSVRASGDFVCNVLNYSFSILRSGSTSLKVQDVDFASRKVG